MSTHEPPISLASEENGWFQLCVSSDSAVTEGPVRRAENAAYPVMMVTADVPAAGKRDRDIRNQLAVPFKITPGFTWEDLKRLRDRWPGKLLVKGILHPDDAVQCADLGCDGIVVSNHGGRQVAFGPPTIKALPGIAKALDGRIEIILDSGVRRGGDVIRAKARGATFVLAGRALAYGVGAGGVAGAQRSMDILKLELERTLGQVGAASYQAVGPGELTSASTRNYGSATVDL